ncbi:MAG TPA: xanthine dehydrogenase family protein molybdopterin-binding subunit [Mycobacteriales bacterium]|nr:xanthine dehydrogenase family protein molybdopterin-binding subunit [Mycobacteriales bacterium]
MSILGTRVLRTEDPKFLTTGGEYTEDLVDERLTGAAHVFFVRSPVAHARITGVDLDAVRAAPGVVAAYTAADLADLPPIKPGMGLKDTMPQTVLAGDVVRYVGEPVAIVVVEDPYQGEDMLELVGVDYDPLPVVVDMRDAAKDEIVLFPEVGTNTIVTYGEELDEHLFDDCEVVVTRTILNQRVAPAPMESRAAAAVWGADGRLTTWVPNQGAQGTKAVLAGMLNVDAAQVRVITPDVGGAFGAKFGADPEHAAVAWVAKALGRPARWAETRYENLLAMTHGRAQYQTVTIGGRPDGTVLAYRLEVLQDAGAYPRIGALLPSLTRLMTPGTYYFPKVESFARSVVTNTTPIGAYRGAGRPEATAAVERAMDLFAAEIGMDPADVRRRNLLEPFTEPHANGFGALYDSGDYPGALERALTAAGYEELRKEQAERRARGDVVQLGIGLASYVEVTGGGAESGAPNENATVEVHPDGSATILTGTSPHGQGHQTAWAMLASEQLGIPVEKIRLKWGDTDLIPKGGGTGGSRSLQQGGAAVRQASIELLDVARERAADALEADPGDLRFDVDRSSFTVAGVAQAAVSLASLAERERLFVHTVFTAPGATFPFGAHVAVVEVDTETGRAVLQRLVAVDDAGVVLNPLLADGQRHGGIAQGVAQALLEEVVYDADGNPLTASFADYPFLSATEVPNYELVDMVTPTTYNPLGAKGIGEAGSIGATPAVQNAVVDAVSHLGVRHIDMPTSPRTIWRAIEEGSGR